MWVALLAVQVLHLGFSVYQWTKTKAVLPLSLPVFSSFALFMTWVFNTWENSYPRNDNYNPDMFWTVVVVMVLAMVHTVHPSASTAVLTRDQTEEWKGWMQIMFLMYHYYRASYMYNSIRVFVSAYVWMTGFGNYLYFTSKADYSWQRVVSMLLRINYLPVLLCLTHDTPLMLYYVVPLHTTYFLVAYATCWLTQRVERPRLVLGAVGVLTALVFETGALAHVADHEVVFRFGLDRYSAWWGMVCAYVFPRIKNRATTVDESMGLVALGILMIVGWYTLCGQWTDKVAYNRVHPYVMIVPILGYLCIRNCHAYVRERHSAFAAWFGLITLETYVLQFHVFMCRNVQHILVLVSSYPTLNMVLVASVFITMSVLCKELTVAVRKTL